MNEEKIKLTVNEENTEYVIQLLNNLLILKEKYKNCYMWSQRPKKKWQQEKEEIDFHKKNPDIELEFENDKIEININYFYSSFQNLNFRVDIFVNGEKKDIRYIKKMIKKLEKK